MLSFEWNTKYFQKQMKIDNAERIILFTFEDTWGNVIYVFNPLNTLIKNFF